MAKKGRSSVEAIKEEVKLSLTPMIDVTFLLLIFFMCNIKFKMLEGKLAAYLPKDKGVTQTDTFLLQEEIRVLLLQEKAKAKFIVWGRRTEGFIPADLAKLFTTVRTAYTQMKQSQDKVPSVIQVEEKVKHGDVVACLNQMLRAGLQDITFTQAASK